MAIPKRINKYNAYKRRKAFSDAKKMKCEQQFPDCPEIPNEKDCKTCVFWKKWNIYTKFNRLLLKQRSFTHHLEGGWQWNPIEKKDFIMMKKTISNLKILYSVNMFTLLSREMHIFHNKPQSERERVNIWINNFMIKIGNDNGTK